MGTTKAMLSEWFDEGVSQGATHMMVVCDTFEYDDYPVYVKPDEDAYKVAVERYGYDPNDPYAARDMQRVMEVYDLRLDKQAQLSERRAFHFAAESEAA